jgi:hypothetical protein
MPSFSALFRLASAELPTICPPNLHCSAIAFCHKYAQDGREVRTDADGRTRDAKSLRQTGISLRLDLGPNPDYRDIAKWARTSPAMIAAFYDQTHPQQSVERIVGFRKSMKGSKQDEASMSESE